MAWPKVMKFYFKLHSFSSNTYVYTPFWVNFCILVWSRGPTSFLLHMYIWLSHTICWRDYSFLYCLGIPLSQRCIQRISLLLGTHPSDLTTFPTTRYFITPLEPPNLWSKSMLYSFYFSLANHLPLKTFIKYLL